jgi:methylmalonyl-CoA decarboxylase
MALIETQFSGKIGTIVFNNEAKKNALCKELLYELIAALSDFSHKNARVVVIRARDDVDVWSSGHDITELPLDKIPLAYDDPLEQALRAIKSCQAPVIAMVQGSAWGGACDLAISCDIVIGDPTCSFAISPVKIGLPYNISGVYQVMERVGLNFAKEMFFTGEPIDAQKADKIGLLNHLVKQSELVEFTYRLANIIVERAPLSVTLLKQQMQLLTGAIALDLEQIEWVNARRRQVFESDDYHEGIQAFLEKRKPVFTGS